MAAAQRDVSLSALVRRFLLSLIEEPPSSMDPKRAQEELLDELWKKYPDFSAQDRVSREEIYKR